MKIKTFFVILVFILYLSAGAEIETQTNWSVSGAYGPVAEWENTYHFQEKINCGSHLTLEHGSFNIIDFVLCDPDEIETCDLNGDGLADVAASGDGIVNWYRNNEGTGLDWTEEIIWQGGNTVNDFKIEDLNGDGFQDAVIALSDKSVIWLENLNGTGESWLEHTVISFPSPVSIVNTINVADMDNDGFIDIICGLGYQGTRLMVNLDGTAMTWQEHNVQDSLVVASDIYPVDLDQDGYTDILFSSYTDGEGGRIHFLRNSLESGTGWEHICISSVVPARYVHYGNINGDVYPDIFSLCCCMGYNKLSWFTNPGAPAPGWSEHLIVNDFTYGLSLQSCDLNGNGLADLLVVKDDEVVYFMNTSGGGNWQYNVLTSEFHSYNLKAVDINQDGNEDIVMGNRDEDQLIWADLCGFYQNGYLESTVLHVSQLPHWNSVSWTSSEPEGTQLGFQLRTSDNFPVMGIWSDTLYAPCSLDTLLAHGEDYIQYRAILTSSDPGETPTLYDISIDWDPIAGVSSNDNGDMSLSVYPNPFAVSTGINFTVAESGPVTLRVYDLIGRLVAEPVNADLCIGNHFVVWQDCVTLPQGCFLLRLDTPCGTITSKCVHIH